MKYKFLSVHETRVPYAVYFIAFSSIFFFGHLPVAAQVAGDQLYRVCAQGQNCNDADARRLQGAYDSSVTTPEQRTKMIEFIRDNTADGITNWTDAAREYFSWRQGPVPDKISSAPYVEGGSKPKAESVSAFKRRVDDMSFSSLMMVDASGLDKKKLKYLEEKRANRRRAVDQAYNSTYCVSPSAYEVAKCVTPIGTISSELCEEVSRCYVVKSVNIVNACPPSQALGRPIVMAMGAAPPDSEPCNYRTAAVGASGPPILIERASFDSFVREKYVTKLGGPSEKKYYIEVNEVYTIAIPVQYFLRGGVTEGIERNLTIRLSGRYDGATTIHEDQISGVVKKLNELKPWFLR